MKILILYSGGLDSFVMKKLAETKYPDAEIEYVWYDIGQGYNYKEQRALPGFVDKKKVDWLTPNQKLVAKSDSKSGSIIIPGRNAVLAILGASQYLPDEIWMGALLGETHKGSTDKNYVFLKHMNEMLAYVYSPFKKNITLKFPLADEGFGKFESVQWAYKHGATIEELIGTSSCLSSEEGNCGHCVVCCRRWGIFSQLGFTEEYNIHPMKVKSNLEMVIEMLKGTHYDEYRKREILPAVKNYFGIEDEDDLYACITKEIEEVEEVEKC